MIRPFDIRELGVVQRLCASGRVLAFELAAVEGFSPLRELARAYMSPPHELSSALVWTPDDAHGTPAAVSLMRVFHAPVTGEHRPRVAVIGLIAPAADSHERVEAWAELAAGQCQVAGDCGAGHTLAEVAEDSGEADALRLAGFVPWVHQDIVKVAGHLRAPVGESPLLREASGDADELTIRLLTQRLTPKPLQRADVGLDVNRLAHRPTTTWLATEAGEAQGWVACYVGRRATALRMLFRPDHEALAQAALSHALARLRPRLQRPLYAIIPGFASWQLPLFDGHGFGHVTSHALMLRSNVASARQPVWSAALNRARTVASRNLLIQGCNPESETPHVQ